MKRYRYHRHKKSRKKRTAVLRGAGQGQGSNINIVAPSLSNNVEAIENLTASIIANIAKRILNKFASVFGVDPSKTPQQNIAELKQKFSNINAALQTPEGQQLKQEMSQLLVESLEILKPSIEKGEIIASEGIQKITRTIYNMIIELLSAFPPATALFEISQLAAAGAQTGATIAKLTTTGTEAYNELNTKVGPKYDSIYHTLLSWMNGVVQSSQEFVDRNGQQLMQQAPSLPSTSTLPSSLPSSLPTASSSFPSKTKEMLGGRISHSIGQFLHPIGRIQTKKRKLL